jgi:hypothetical protein
MIALVLAAVPFMLPPVVADGLVGTWLASVPAPRSSLRYTGPGRPPAHLRLALVIERERGAAPRAYVVEPELNYGALLRGRTVHEHAGRVSLTATGRRSVTGRILAGHLALDLPGLGAATFRRATLAEGRALTSTSRDSVPVGAGALIPDAAHASVVRVFTRELAAPLSITRYAFPLQPAPPHVAYLGGGQRLRPRDALKFGQLILDAGRWNGRRVVDARWIHVIITPQAHVRGEIGAYGEAWHIYTYVVRGRRVTAISAGGNGGQLVFAIPAYDLVIAINAGNYNQYPVWRSFITSTIPAILDAVAGSGGHSRIAGDTR